MKQGHQCHVERRWQSDVYRVWLWTQQRSSVVVLQFDGGMRKEIEVADGEPWPEPPTLELSGPELEALAGGLSDYVPPSEATSLHLKDTIEVRDRLLTIVERET